ncbi:SGNH/GDSL hydrolase family protein [Actinophytocola sp.]|uniref:SGNH/GDSL hydrolase family protein n=1 Tax=Actinophytocola sp. TaxID=1872138 RepID=UPI002ED58D24
MGGVRAIKALVVAAGSVGGLSGAAYGLLNGQSRRARSIIGTPRDLPLNADGLYLPNGAGPFAPTRSDHLSFAMLGDSLAAGLGVESPDQLPGVRLAHGLADELDVPVRLMTHAVSGSRTTDLEAQVDRALINPPDLALVIIGGNDVTARTSIGASATLLGRQVARLVETGATVVVGTCPDLAIIRAIPQPLRTIASRYSLSLARAQRRVLDQMGVRAVSVAALLAPEFGARPHDLFSADRFHPNGKGYEYAAAVLLAPLCTAARSSRVASWSGT